MHYINPKQYFYVLLLSVVILITLMLVSDYWQIHLWQHDSAYYDYSSLFLKIGFEGRWLTPYISLIFLPFDGRLIAILNLLFLFAFFFIVCKRYINHNFYAFIFAALSIQIPPVSYLLIWPVVTAAATLILMTSAIVVQRLPLLVFYSLFGILFFATASNFYYLLPLLHLPLLNKAHTLENLRVVCFKIIPNWAFGFICGYIIMLVVVYFYTGHLGLELRNWRNPNPVQNMDDLLINFQKSLGYLVSHLRYFFDSVWTICIISIAVIVSTFSNKHAEFVSLAFIATGILLVHYVVSIPAGIDIAIRTMFSTWIGILSFAFLTKFPSRWSLPLYTFLAIGLTLVFYSENRKNINWYAEVSNHFREDLLNVLPESIKPYRGILFISDNHTVFKSNLVVLYKHDLARGKIPWLNTDTRWATSAYDAGFDEVYLCGTRDKYHEICLDLRANQSSIQPLPKTKPLLNSLNVVVGHYKNYLVLRLAPEKNPLKPGWKPEPP